MKEFNLHGCLHAHKIPYMTLTFRHKGCTRMEFPNGCQYDQACTYYLESSIHTNFIHQCIYTCRDMHFQISNLRSQSIRICLCFGGILRKALDS